MRTAGSIARDLWLLPQHTGPPDYVGIGAQRSGTTRWFRLLAQHPDVATTWANPGTGHKEAHYYDTSIAASGRYSRLFPRRRGQIAGEWTPDYITVEAAPWLLRRDAPAARILVLLRDPLERLQSGLAWDNEADDAIERGLYAKHLRRWLDWFPREQFLIQQYERTVTDPDAELARLYSFLGLPPFTPDGVSDKVGYWREPKKPVPADLERRALAVFQPDIEDLRAICPDFDYTRWPTAH